MRRVTEFEADPSRQDNAGVVQMRTKASLDHAETIACAARLSGAKLLIRRA